MAPPAADLGTLWRRVWQPTPGRFTYAARLALICAATAVVTAWVQTPSPAVTSYTAFFFNKRDRASSLVLCVVMTLLITFIVGITIGVAKLVFDSNGWRVAAMAAISLVFLFLASASKLRPIGAIVAMIVAYGLDLLGSFPSGDYATRALLYVWLFVAIPAGVSVVVNVLLAPAPRRVVEAELAQRFRTAAAVLREPEGLARAALDRLLAGGSAEIEGGLKFAGLERTSSPADLVALRRAADASVALLTAVQLMARSPQAMLPEPVRHALARAIEPLADAFERGGHPARIDLAPIDRMTLAPAAAATCEAIEAALAHLVHAPAAAPAAPAAPAPKKAGFFLPDAFTNPDHVQYAAKTTAAAMFCYLTFSILSWPGIHTCLITCYIVALPTAADSIEKLTLRVAGCLVGAALGVAAMVFVVPAYASVGVYFLIVFAGALASTWVAAGSPRIAYAGFQIAFAYFLCVVDAAPSFDLTVARDRVIGMLFGNVVMYLVSARIWPVSVAGRIEAGIRGAVQRLVEMARARDDTARVRLAAQAHAALGAAEADLEIAGYEPASVRPAPRWLRLRRSMVARAAAIEGPLLLAARRGDAASVTVAHRLERLGEASVPFLEEAGRADPGPLRSLIEPHLAVLEATAAAARRMDKASHAVA